MNNVAIFGSSGQLGKTLQFISKNYGEYNYFFLNKEQLDICNKELLDDFIKKFHIGTIINCAAYTNVDLAECEYEKANKINCKCVGIMAQLTKKYNLKFVHISTDYVFDGSINRPYKEEDEKNPLGIYGKTKLKGEQAILKISPQNTIIIRTSWLYGVCGKNFLRKIQQVGQQKQELNVVFDQIGTPTYTRDLAEVILNILPTIQNKEPEIYHYSNEGVASWYDFAKAIIELLQLKCRVNPVTTKEFPTLAQRPHYSILNKDKIKQKFNIKIPYWRDSLRDCIEQLQKEAK